MPDSPSERRLIENEKVLRRHNIRSKQAVKKLLSAAEEATDLPVKFACECSNPTCSAQVSLSISEYEQVHLRNDRFVVVKGHELPSIEKVVKTNDDFAVVEKLALKA